MAVFTEVSNTQLDELLSHYDIGQARSLKVFESFGSFCHPVFGQVLGSPSINVLKFNIH